MIFYSEKKDILQNYKTRKIKHSSVFVTSHAHQKRNNNNKKITHLFYSTRKPYNNNKNAVRLTRLYNTLY
ncbi:hypothetical protein BD770DRAFT_191163 [Pilaira anomala]|nr:hypothetical protein BD770DRAFT_191163 [Pilaira anomala]